MTYFNDDEDDVEFGIFIEPRPDDEDEDSPLDEDDE